MTEAADHYLVQFECDVRSISSAPYNGGCGLRRRYINRHVNNNYASDVKVEVEEFLMLKGIPDSGTVVTLTAADISKYVRMSKRVGDWYIDLFLTAGLDNALSIGNRYGKPGTINIAVITDMPLNQSAMVNLIQSIVESKAQFMNDHDVRDIRTDRRAPGTSTDTVSIFVTTAEEKLEYAGRLTDAGYYTSMMVYNALALSHKSNRDRS
ncbi:MAG: hypothetical protein F6Q11_01220 [Thermoplasma sp.]|nr:MAG: hypothetical protein F6Q11_01220 [Thermoplasma sp.]